MAGGYDIGPRLGIEGEAQFKSGLAAANASIKALASEMAACSTKFANQEKSTEALTKKNEILNKQIDQHKQKLNLLNSQYQTQTSKLQQLGEALEQAKQEFGENSDEAARAQNAYNRQSAECSRLHQQIQDTTRSIDQMTGELDENQQEIDELSESSSGAGDKLKAFGSVLKDGLVNAAHMAADALKAAAGAVAGFLKDSVSVGSNFDASMAQVAATMGTTVDQIQDLREFAKEMGASTAFSASQAADALNYMALAGYSADESMEMLPGVLNLAAAGGIELAAASDMVTDAQSALGLTMDETSQLVDKMAKASSKSNTSVAQLGEAILVVGGTAKNLAGGTTELSTALGILADNGVKGAEGGTALRNIILSLSAPTDKAAAQMKELGLNAFDADGNLRPLNETFGDLDKKLSTMTQEEKTKALNTIFNKTDLKSVEALLTNCGDRFDELSGYIDNAGVTAEMFSEQLKSVGVSSDGMLKSLEGMGISSDTFSAILKDCKGDASMFTEALHEAADAGVSYDDILGTMGGNLDAVQTALDGCQGAAEAMANTQLDNLPGDITKFQSALEGAQISISEGLTPTLREFVQFGTNALSDLTDAFNEGGISGISEALGGIIGDAVVMITQMMPSLIEAVVGIIQSIVATLIENAPILMEGIGQVITTLLTTIGEAIPSLMEAGSQLIDMLCQGFQSGIPLLMEQLPNVITSILELFYESLPSMMESGMQLLMSVVEGILSGIPQLLAGLPEVLQAFLDYFTESLPQIVDMGVDMLLQLIDGILDTIPELVDAIPELISAFLDTITQNLPKIIESGVGIILKLVEGLIQAIPKIIAAVPQLIQSLIRTITQNLPQIIQQGITLVENLVKGIIQNLPAIARAASELIRTVVQSAKNLASDIIGIGKDIVEGIKKGITQKWQQFTGWLDKKVGGLVSGVKKFLGIASPSKVFAGIGGYMAEGLGVGFGEEIGAVESQIQRSMADLTDSASGEISVTSRGGGAASAAGMSTADAIAAAVRSALQGASVYMDGRKVGNLITSRQSDAARARGAALVPV